MNGERAVILVAPAFLGAAWGFSQPLSKFAVTGGWEPWAIVTWQAVISALLAVVLSLRSGPVRWSAGALWRWAMVGLIGTLIPHAASYRAVQDIPAGVMALVLATVPMAALAFGLVAGTERWSARRLAGIGAGISGVAIVAASRDGFSTAVPLVALGIALIAPICYAFSNTILDAKGRAGLNPLHLMAGAALVTFPFACALALATGQFRVPTLAAADLAMMAVSVIHALCFTALLWLIGKAGAVFAGLTGFFVTGFGVLWSMLLLSERYPPAVWAALALIFAGLMLVRPRNKTPLAGQEPFGEDVRRGAD